VNLRRVSAKRIPDVNMLTTLIIELPFKDYEACGGINREAYEEAISI
jgi:hypothetical protein